MRQNSVLLIEDDVWLSELYESVLADTSSVTRVGSAEAALDAIDIKTFDLIMLDMFLPDHNGIEFLHEVASYQDSAEIPIIILSAVHPRNFALPENRWGHYGIVEYLYKPVTKPKQLKMVVEKHLHTFVQNQSGR